MALGHRAHGAEDSDPALAGKPETRTASASCVGQAVASGTLGTASTSGSRSLCALTGRGTQRGLAPLAGPQGPRPASPEGRRQARPLRAGKRSKAALARSELPRAPVQLFPKDAEVVDLPVLHEQHPVLRPGDLDPISRLQR